MPLSVLSYASIIGILSTFFITAVIFIDGFSKKEAPGSLWDPANTSLEIHSLGELGVAFGLFMAGVSLHVYRREMHLLNTFDSSRGMLLSHP